MAIFISYSHNDKEFVDNLAAHLVKHRANVWVDRWELSVGDSILGKIQDAIEDSSALLVILSKSSVQSEWCKKELTVGLMRELDEKKVIVLPVLLDDCKIPLFLSDKMYADFRSEFNSGLHSILDAVARVINPDQGRFSDDEATTDWAVDWGYRGSDFELRFTIVNVQKSLPMTFLTEIHVLCNEAATKRYQQYEAIGLDWAGRLMISEYLFDIGEKQDIRLLLEDQFPQSFDGGIEDPKLGVRYTVHATCRKLGEDNGKDQLIDVSDSIKNIRHYMRSISRQLTPDEMRKVIGILQGPFPS